MEFDKVFLVSGEEFSRARQRKCVYMYVWARTCRRVLSQDLANHMGFWFENPDCDKAVLLCIDHRDRDTIWTDFPELKSIWNNERLMSEDEERLFFNVFAYNYNGINHDLPSISHFDVRRAIDNFGITGNPLSFLRLPGFLGRPQDHIDSMVLPPSYRITSSDFSTEGRYLLPPLREWHTVNSNLDLYNQHNPSIDTIVDSPASRRTSNDTPQRFRVSCDLDPNTFLPISRATPIDDAIDPYETDIGPNNTPLGIRQGIPYGEVTSLECSRGFSSKAKRQEINLKLREKLSKPHQINVCAHCQKTFSTRQNTQGRNQRYCSNSCRQQSSTCNQVSKEAREKLSLARIKKIQEGVVNSSGTKCQFSFQNEIIKCDSRLEYSCLLWFTLNYQCSSMKRNGLVIPYVFNDHKKLFLPDFLITTDSSQYLVEVKSIISVQSVNEKWHFYNETSLLKEKALINFCEGKNLTPFWYTMKTDTKLYRKVIQEKI
jgi:hypothetical protein